jgi:hypothetical protein
MTLRGWRRRLRGAATLLGAAALLGAGSACKRPEPTAVVDDPSDPRAVELVKRAVETHGGYAALKAGLSQYSLEVSTQIKGMTIRSTIHWQAPDRSAWSLHARRLKSVTVGGMCREVVDSVSRPCPKDAVRTLRSMWYDHVTNIYPLVEPGIRLRYLGVVQERGQRQAQVQAVDRARGFKLALYFNHQTGQLMGDDKVQRVDGKDLRVHAEIVRAKRHGRLLLPTEMVFTHGRRTLSRMTIHSIKLGRVDPGAFHPVIK